MSMRLSWLPLNKVLLIIGFMLSCILSSSIHPLCISLLTPIAIWMLWISLTLSNNSWQSSEIDVPRSKHLPVGPALFFLWRISMNVFNPSVKVYSNTVKLIWEAALKHNTSGKINTNICFTWKKSQLYIIEENVINSWAILINWSTPKSLRKVGSFYMSWMFRLVNWEYWEIIIDSCKRWWLKSFVMSI